MSEQFDEAIVMDLLRQVAEHLESTQKSFESVPDAAFFSASHPGKEKLASICMFLMVVGEQIRKVDKLTNGLLPAKYPNTDWRRIVTFRHIIAHDYVHIDSEIVFNICSKEIEPLMNTVNRVIEDLKNNLTPD